MAVREFGRPPVNHFEYTQTIRESNIAQRIDDNIINPLKEELDAYSSKNKMSVKRGNLRFDIEPTMCGIRRFAVSDPENNYFYEVVVKEDFIEVKTEDVSGQNPKRHIWNCPEALEIVDSLLSVFTPQKDSSDQGLLFQA